MKALIFFLGFLSFSFDILSQELLNMPLRTLNGSMITVDSMVSSRKGIILVFWEPMNTTCYNNLENLQEAWSSNIKSLGVDLVAICVDREGNHAKLKPLVNGKSWDFDVFVDDNGGVKRLLGINTIPYTILLDENKEVKCRYSGYCSGDEVQLCNKIEHCLKTSGTLKDLK